MAVIRYCASCGSRHDAQVTCRTRAQRASEQDAAEGFVRQMDRLRQQVAPDPAAVQQLGEAVPAMTGEDTRTAAEALEQHRSGSEDTVSAVGLVEAAQRRERMMARLCAVTAAAERQHYEITGNTEALRAMSAAAERQRREAMGAATGGTLCYHPYQITRRYPEGGMRTSCPACFANRAASYEIDTHLSPGELVQTRVVTREGFSQAQQAAAVAGMSPQEAAQALDAVTEGSWCFHPGAVGTYRVPAGSGAVPYYTVRCSDCGSEASRSGTLPRLSPTRMQPEVPGWEEPVRERVSGYTDVRSDVGSAPWELRGVPSGLGTTGRNVPGHRPESWQSGQPWDRTETPDRDEVPERGVPGGTRAAADRVYRGVW